MILALLLTLIIPLLAIQGSLDYQELITGKDLDGKFTKGNKYRKQKKVKVIRWPSEI